MNVLKRIASTCVVALVLTLPSYSIAAGGSGDQTIQRVEISASGEALIRGNTGAWSNPDVCESSIQTVLKDDNAAYSEIYALLVASFLQGKTINTWLTGCTNVNGTTYPIIISVKSF